MDFQTYFTALANFPELQPVIRDDRDSNLLGISLSTQPALESPTFSLVSSNSSNREETENFVSPARAEIEEFLRRSASENPPTRIQLQVRGPSLHHLLRSAREPSVLGLSWPPISVDHPVHLDTFAHCTKTD